MKDNNSFEIKLIPVKSIERVAQRRAPKSNSSIPIKAFDYQIDTTTLIHRLSKSIYRIYGFEVSKVGLIVLLTILILIISLELAAFSSQLTRNLTGFVASLPGFVSLLLASKQSCWSYALGISWDRALGIHKVCGVLMLMTGLMHAYVNWDRVQTKIEGFYLLSSVALLLVLAINPIRRKMYVWFIRFHASLVFAMAVFAAMHGARLIVIGFILWFIDLLFRFKTAFSNRKRLFNAKVISKELVTEIQVETQGFSHKIGHYVLLYIPDVSYWELHPFTIASEPEEKTLRFYIEPKKGWTKRLHELGKQTSNVRLTIDGPYGSLPFDIDGPQYKTFLLVAGGMGITPIKAFLNYLSKQYKNSRNILNIVVVWSFRDIRLVSEVLDQEELFSRYLVSSVFQFNKSQTQPVTRFKMFYTSREKELESKINVPLDPSLYTLELTRPNLGSFFDALIVECKVLDEKRVAVICSGPSSMVQETSDLCRKKSVRGISFDFHSDCFEF